MVTIFKIYKISALTCKRTINFTTLPPSLLPCLKYLLPNLENCHLKIFVPVISLPIFLYLSYSHSLKFHYLYIAVIHFFFLAISHLSQLEQSFYILNIRISKEGALNEAYGSSLVSSQII